MMSSCCCGYCFPSDTFGVCFRFGGFDVSSLLPALRLLCDCRRPGAAFAFAEVDDLSSPFFARLLLLAFAALSGVSVFFVAVLPFLVFAAPLMSALSSFSIGGSLAFFFAFFLFLLASFPLLRRES